MSDAEGDDVPQPAPVGEMDVNTALQEVLKTALVHDGLARGLHEAAKALDRREAHLCILANNCDETQYVKLVEALCAEHNIHLLKLLTVHVLNAACLFNREGGMDVRLFKRHSERHPHAVVSLEHQYRMNQDIMELSNTPIYENRLKYGTESVALAVLELPGWDELLSYIKENTADTWLLDALTPSCPVVFLDTDQIPAPESRSEHLVSNETEALLVHQLACGLLKGGLQPATLGIISPYRHQLKLISQVVHRDTKQQEIEINTVDKYQGRDKSCIIVSLVRSNEHCNVGDLLRDWRRVNVAVTRAKRKLILIGSLSTLKGSLLLQELLDLLERKDWVQILPRGAHNLMEFMGTSSQATPVKSLETSRIRF